MRFPIFQREFRVASRDPRLHRGRVVVVLAGILAFALVLQEVLQRGLVNSVGATVALKGLEMLLFILALLMGGASTVSAFAAEKRDGLLPLLFLTNVSAREVAFGKFAAHLWTLGSMLAGLAPILCLPLLLGGVSGTEIALSVAGVLSTLVYSASMGLMFSATAKNESESAVLFVTLMLMLLVFPFLAAGSLHPFDPWLLQSLSPGFVPIQLQSFGLSFSTAQKILAGILVQCGFSLLFFELAARSVRRCWRLAGEVEQPKTLRLTLTSAVPLAARRDSLGRWAHVVEQSRRRRLRRWLDRDPFAWLAMRFEPEVTLLWAGIATLLAAWGCSYGLLYFSFSRSNALDGLVAWIISGVKGWVGFVVCRRWIEDRAGGGLELMLTTPMTLAARVRGQFRACVRLFGLPLMGFCFIQLAWHLWATDPWRGRALVGDWGRFAVFWLVTWLDLVAIVWGSMAIGLKLRDPVRAAAIVVGFVLLCPVLGNWLGTLFVPGVRAWGVSQSWIKELSAALLVDGAACFWAHRSIRRPVLY